MRDEYIKKVRRALTLPRKQTRAIIRDLNEAFDSAAEHGETEGQLIDRLGTPEDFAAGMEETMGGKSQHRSNRSLVLIGGLCAMAALCLIGALIAKIAAPPDDVIGTADAMTTIVVRGASSLGPLDVLLIIGAALAVAAAVLIINRVRKGKMKLEEMK